MKNIIKKFICKNIVKILTIYRDGIEHNKLNFKKDIDMTIYFEIGELIKYIEEKIKEDEKERIEENGIERYN